MDPEIRDLSEQCLHELYAWCLHTGWHDAFEKRGYKLVLGGNQEKPNIIKITKVLVSNGTRNEAA